MEFFGEVLRFARPDDDACDTDRRDRRAAVARKFDRLDTSTSERPQRDAE